MPSFQAHFNTHDKANLSCVINRNRESLTSAQKYRILRAVMLECLEFLIFLGDMICYLEQRRPETNRQRFYAVAVKQDLFGDWLLCRRWGRIDTRGRGLVEAFSERGAAEDAARALIQLKTRRGYSRVGQGT